MKIAMFSTRSYDIKYFDLSLKEEKEISFEYFDTQLNVQTAQLAQGADAVCVFVNDDLSAPVLKKLCELGIKIIALRCAGFNNVDIYTAKEKNMIVLRVPAYSPEAVAEHSIALMMTLNRRIHKAYQRTRDANFSLEGLVGFNLFGKIVGVIGTGKIGLALIKILKGFGCHVLAYDPYPSEYAKQIGANYVELDELFKRSDVISLHCPLTETNHHLMNSASFAKMKDGVMLINTSRGGLLNATDAIQALKVGRIGSLGLDVYEEEEVLFFGDHSNEIITDDIFRRLSACHNVIFTGHQAFLTREALSKIAEVTIMNLLQAYQGTQSANEVL